MKRSLRVLLTVVLMVAMAFANTQGPNSGTTAGASWTNPTNAQVTDAVYATCTTNNAPCSSSLSGSTYGFSIPAGATINGITVTLVVHSANNAWSLNNAFGGTGICVTKTAATCAGTSKIDAAAWATTDVTLTEGSGADLWGTTWTASDINATGFGVSINPENGVALSKQAAVDSMLITVTFTPAAASSSSGFLKMFGFNQKPKVRTQTRTFRMMH
jgi:hypothetical protein